MKKVFMFTYSIAAYLIGFASILYWIASVSHLFPEISIDQSPELPFWMALSINIGWVFLFGLQHSIMARKPVKTVLIKYLPKPIERSTFVLISGVLLTLLVANWQPMGGLIWEVQSGTPLYYGIYILFFTGWAILFVSTFLINHFDLFGLRQTYLELVNKPYTEINFKVISLYKYVRHPLYFGGILGLWATPRMTVTHLVFAIGLTAYFVVGTLFEEQDLKRQFGDLYKDYKARTPMLLPFTKLKPRRTASKYVHHKGVTNRS